jgi:hypothetical protein
MNTLEKLKELQAAATPGPWEFDPIGVTVYKKPVGNGEKICDIRGWGWLLHKHDNDEAREAEQNANARIIVQLRNNAEALLEVVEAAQAVLSGEQDDVAALMSALAQLTEEV